MRLRKALRVALVAEWVLIAASLVASALLEGSLPAPLQGYLKAESERDLETLDVVMLPGLLGSLLATLTATVGLFLFKIWARRLYLAATLLGYGVLLIGGPSIEHPAAGALGDLAVLVSGLILGLVYFTEVLELPRELPATGHFPRTVK